MTTTDFIDVVQEVSGGTKKEAKEIIDAFTKAIKATLVKGEDVQLTGFGKFSVSETKAKEGRNPKTGEPLAIPASVKVNFKAGTKLKDEVKQALVK